MLADHVDPEVLARLDMLALILFGLLVIDLAWSALKRVRK